MASFAAVARLSVEEKRRLGRPDHHLFRCQRCGTKVRPEDAAGHALRCPKRPAKKGG